MKLRPIKVWTWAIQGHSGAANRFYLCYCAFSTRSALEASGKPSPEAIAVQAVMHPVEEKGIACEKARKDRRG